MIRTMTRAAMLAAWLAVTTTASAAVEEAVADVQREWETTKYRMSGKAQESRYEELAAKAHQVSAAYPDRAEPLIWEGIVVSSLAGAKGGLGALGLVKQAKALYETALKLKPEALDGSAYNSLGVLYYKVPGWPVGFGDKAKAQELLQKALAINPAGIDPNFFYGEYLVETGKAREALPYLERALQAPPRPGREIADAGRRDEVKALMDKARAEAK
jgi:tetratricopeptide (TPR) repeat protein